jgi:hypothetical protein
MRKLREIWRPQARKSVLHQRNEGSIQEHLQCFKRRWLARCDLRPLKLDALRNYLKRGKDGITLLSFREATLPSKPEEVNKDNLYQQLLFLERVASQSGVSAVKTILQRYENFKPSEIERIVDLLLKSYAIKQNKGVKLSSKEKEEMEILKGMQDVLKGKFVKIGGTTLEDFI